MTGSIFQHKFWQKVVENFVFRDQECLQKNNQKLQYFAF